MNILVTGCAGFIGSHLCEHYLRAGHVVVGVDNMSQSYDPLLKRENLFHIDKTSETTDNPFIFYETDVRHQDQIAQIGGDHKIDTILHFAGGVALDNPRLCYETELMGTLNLLEEARKLGIKRLVYASGCGDADSSPEISAKHVAETVLQTWHHLYQMSVLCLRLCHVYGPRQQPDTLLPRFFAFVAKDQKIPVYGDGSQIRDFVFIDDAISGISKAVEWMESSTKPVYEIFDMGSSQGMTVNDVILEMEKALNKKISVQNLPKNHLHLDRIVADGKRAREVFGFDPKIKIEVGLSVIARSLKGDVAI